MTCACLFFAWFSPALVVTLTFEIIRLRPGKRSPWNHVQVQSWRASKVEQVEHILYLTVKAFYVDLVDQRTMETLDPGSRRIVEDVSIERYPYHGDGCPHDYCVSSALGVEEVERAILITNLRLLTELGPRAVRPVDAWKLPDWLLDSSLGRYYGRVHEDLFHRASQMNPLKQGDP